MAWSIPADWDYKEAPGSAKMNEQIRDNLVYLKASLPAGVMMDYGGATAPDQWLICNGSAISRTTYADLFAAIGTSYGVGNGSTTFNIPDRRGTVSIGLKSTDSDFNALGETGGAKTVSVAHTHTVPSHTHGMKNHTHLLGIGWGGGHLYARYDGSGYPVYGHTTYASVYQGFASGTFNSRTADLREAISQTPDDNTSDASGTANTGAMSANATPSIVQPYLVSNVIIKY